MRQYRTLTLAISFILVCVAVLPCFVMEGEAATGEQLAWRCDLGNKLSDSYQVPKIMDRTVTVKGEDTDGADEGAIQIQPIPDFTNILNLSGENEMVSGIYVNPNNNWAYVSTAKWVFDNYAERDLVYPGSLYTYDLDDPNAILVERKVGTFPSAIRDIGFHPNPAKNYALVLFGTDDSVDSSVKILNLATYALTDVEQVGGVTSLDFNTVDFTENGDYAFVGLDERLLCIFMDSDRKLYDIDNLEDSLTREYMVRETYKVFIEQEYDNDDWNTDFVVENPPLDPASTILGYLNGFLVDEQLTTLATVLYAIGIAVAAAVAIVSLFFVATALAFLAAAPFVACAASSVAIGQTVLAATAATAAGYHGGQMVDEMIEDTDGEYYLTEEEMMRLLVEWFARMVSDQGISDIEIITEDAGAGPELLITGLDYIAIMNKTPPRVNGKLLSDVPAIEKLYGSPDITEKFYTHTSGQNLYHKETVDLSREMWSKIVTSETGEWYIFGNRIDVEADNVHAGTGMPIGITGYTITPIYRTFNPNTRVLSSTEEILFSRSQGTDFSLVAAESYNDDIVLFLKGFNIDNELKGYMSFFPKGGVSSEPIETVDSDGKNFMPVSFEQIPNSNDAIVGSDYGLYRYNSNDYYSAGSAEFDSSLGYDGVKKTYSEYYNIADNIGIVTMSWEDDVAFVPGSTVSCWVSVTGGDNYADGEYGWHEVGNGIPFSIMDYFNCNTPTGRALYKASDLTGFQYRFNLTGDGSTTPSVVNVDVDLIQVSPPEFTLNIKSPVDPDTADNVEFFVTWKGGSNTAIHSEVFFSWDYGDVDSGQENTKSGFGQMVGTHRYIKGGYYAPKVNGSYTVDVYTFTYEATLPPVYIINRNPIPRVRDSGGRSPDLIMFTSGDAVDLTAADPVEPSNDPDGTVMNYTWQGLRDNPGTRTFGTTAYVTGNTTVAQVNAFGFDERSFTLAVRDDGDRLGNNKKTTTHTFLYRVYYDNCPPTASGTLAATGMTHSALDEKYRVQYGQQITLTSTSIDRDGDGIKETRARFVKGCTGEVKWTSMSVGNIFTLTPTINDLGEYDVQLNVTDNSGKSHDNSGWVSIGTLRVMPAPATGDWTITGNLTLEPYCDDTLLEIQMNGNIIVSQGANVVMKNVSIEFIDPASGDGITVYQGAKLTMYDCNVDAWWEQNSIMSWHAYWYADIIGEFYAYDCLFSHVGHKKNPITNDEVSGITFADYRPLGSGQTFYGRGLLRDCEIYAAQSHGISTRSIYQVEVRESIIHHSLDESQNSPVYQKYTVSSQVYVFKGANLYLLDTRINTTGGSSSGYGVYAAGTLKMDGCTLENNDQADILSNGGTLYVTDSFFGYSWNGIIIHNGEQYFEDNIIVSHRKTDNEGVWIEDTDNTGTFINNTVEGYNTGFYSASNIVLSIYGNKLKNVGARAYAGGRLYMYNYIRLKVTDNGQPKEGAEINVTTNGNEVWDGETDANGETPWLTVMDRSYTLDNLTQYNTTATVTTYGYSESYRVNTRESGTTFTYEARKPVPVEEPASVGSGSSWYSRKSGDGFFSLSMFWWIIIIFTFACTAGLAAALMNMDYKEGGVIALVGGVFLTLMMMFVANGYVWGAILTGVVVGIIAWLILDKIGIIKKVRG